MKSDNEKYCMSKDHYLSRYNDLNEGRVGFLRDGKVVGSERTSQLFVGSNIERVLGQLLKFISSRNRASRILDYGCGKAQATWKACLNGKTIQERALGKIQQYYCYDPGFNLYAEPPALGSKFDAIICADVMEHIPFDQVNDVLNEISNYLTDAGLALFSICCVESRTAFLDGENTHCTLLDPDQWMDLIRAALGLKSVYVKFEIADNISKDFYHNYS